MSFGCVICSDLFDSTVPPNDENSIVALKKCGHTFHQSCIRTWLLRPGTTSCPICRCQASISSVTQLHFPSVPLPLDTSMEVNLAIKESLKEAKKEELSELKFKLATLQSHYAEMKDVFLDFQDGLKKVEAVIERHTGVSLNTPPVPASASAATSSSQYDIFSDSFLSSTTNNYPSPEVLHARRIARAAGLIRNQSSESVVASGAGAPIIQRPKVLRKHLTNQRSSSPRESLNWPQTRAYTLRRQATLARQASEAASSSEFVRPRMTTIYPNSRSSNMP